MSERLEDISLEPTPTEEELAQQAQQAEDAEFARRVRREVRRIESGEAEQDIEQDEIEEAEQKAAEEQAAEQKAEEEEKRHKRSQNIFWLIISGNILLREGVSKYYSQMVVIAVMFFVSIVVMFWSLHLDMRYSQISRNVQLLREKSVRLQEERYQKCSHSAISSELKRRGIELNDPTRPSTVIEEGR